MTAYSKCVPSGVDQALCSWVPWRNVQPCDMELFPQLALHNWIRRRGGILPNERFDVLVLTYDDSNVTSEHDKPEQCLATMFTVCHKEFSHDIT